LLALWIEPNRLSIKCIGLFFGCILSEMPERARLEGYVGAKVEYLTPKTTLQSYYEHDYESFLAVLKKNRKKLAIDPACRKPAEALKAELEGSMGKLLPLRERADE